MAALDEVLAGQAPAGDIVGAHPAARPVTRDAVDVDDGNPLLGELLEPEVVVFDRGDDDAVHPLLREHVEVLLLAHRVEPVVHDHDADAETFGLGLCAEGHVDEVRVAEVGHPEPESAFATGAELARRGAGGEIEFRDGGEHSFPHTGGDVARAVEHVAHRSRRHPRRPRDIADRRHAGLLWIAGV